MLKSVYITIFWKHNRKHHKKSIMNSNCMSSHYI